MTPPEGVRTPSAESAPGELEGRLAGRLAARRSCGEVVSAALGELSRAFPDLHLAIRYQTTDGQERLEVASSARSVKIQRHGPRTFPTLPDERRIPVSGQAELRVGSSVGVAPEQVRRLDGVGAIVALALDRAATLERSAAPISAPLPGSGSAGDAASRAQRFAAALAHELNNPLTTLIAYSEKLERHVAGDSGASPEVRERIQRLREASERLHRLAHDVRSYGRPSFAQLEEVTVQALFERAVAFATAEHDGATAVTFESELPDVLTVRVQKERVIQSLTHVLVNALRAIGDGPGRVKLLGKASSVDWVLLEVHDSGPGIPPSLRADVMEPFYTTRRAEGATGLGLTLVRDVLWMHGGTVEIRAGCLGGAAVLMTLPRAQG